MKWQIYSKWKYDVRKEGDNMQNILCGNYVRIYLPIIYKRNLSK